MKKNKSRLKNLKNNQHFEEDKKEIMLKIKEEKKLFPENNSLQKLLELIERSTLQNFDGGLSYFVVDSFSGNYELGEKIIRFEKRFMNSTTKY